MKICILAAGKGTRMGPICKNINKSLLPINNKAIISHIIEKFSKTDSFVIGLGYKAEQVKSYLKAAHSDKKFEFVKIKNFDGKGSGPGLSLLNCRNHLNEPFIFLPCDCIFSDKLENLPNENWIGVSKVMVNESDQYCNVGIKNKRVVDIRDKIKSSKDYYAFTGLLFVKDYKEFWNGLKKNVMIKKERQVSNGLVELMKGSGLYTKKIKWNDIGDLKKYKEIQKRFDSKSIAKTNEFIYFINNKVIKFFSDEKIVEKRVKKAKVKPKIFPNVERCGKNFYWYRLWNGRPLYSCVTPALFKKLLNWLDEKVWTNVDLDSTTTENLCKDFYYKKTMSRISLFQKENPNFKFPKIINGKSVPSLKKLLEQIPWSRLFTGIPSFIHGDLQFQNILYSRKLGEFLLIDWRQDFAGNIEVGDLYYDLAKLYGGIIMNYDYIMKDLYNFHQDGNNVTVSLIKWKNDDNYQKILDDYIKQKNLDFEKIRLLVGLIYINMAALHHSPFNFALISLGSSIISDVLNEK
jgi:NDP-sugar pyrophosphorylase family protein